MAEETEDKTKFLHLARKRFKDAKEAHDTNRDKYVSDLKFLEADGNQWPEDLRKDRESDGRPCLEINKLPTHVDQVLGDQRQNRPAIKIIPWDSESDPEIAQVFTGHIRNIEATSDAEIAYDTAFECQAEGGFGFFRILAEYADDDVFEQDIRVKRIPNPLVVTWDPAAQELNLSDARFMFITEEIPRDEFEEKYPGKAPVRFDDKDPDVKDWSPSEDSITIAEYMVKKPITKTLWKVASGEVWDSTRLDDKGQPTTKEKLQADGVEIVAEREVKTHEIEWYKINGYDILEGPLKWPSKYFGIIPVWGKELNIEGRRILRGLIRNAKDPQRLYNYYRSLSAEVIALAPKAPYLVTPKQIQNFEKQWDDAHKKNFPYLLFNVDPDMPNRPQKETPTTVETGIQNEIMIADQEMHDATGLQPPSLGKARTEQQSGRALLQIERAGDVGSFAYIDNLARALRFAGRVMLDMIPKIYDTERTIRLMGEDGDTENALINTKTPEGQRVFKENGLTKVDDITVGKYDVTVTVGPSYTTQRQEAAASMMEFLKAMPGAAPVIGHLVAKNMDWPGSQEISDKLKMLDPTAAAEQQQPGGPPVEGGPMGGMMPPGPPPQAQAAAETLGEVEVETAEVKLAQEKAKLEQEKAKIRGLELDNQLKRAKLNVPQSPRSQKTD